MMLIILNNISIITFNIVDISLRAMGPPHFVFSWVALFHTRTDQVFVIVLHKYLYRMAKGGLDVQKTLKILALPRLA